MSAPVVLAACLLPGFPEWPLDQPSGDVDQNNVRQYATTHAGSCMFGVHVLMVCVACGCACAQVRCVMWAVGALTEGLGIHVRSLLNMFMHAIC